MPLMLKVTINPNPTENIIPDTVKIVFMKKSSGRIGQTNEIIIKRTITNNILIIVFTFQFR
jgi:hypothetical protein